MKLKLASNLTLPVDVVTEKLAWLGRTGSGKTYGAMKLAELMLRAGGQVGVIDPVGVWRALRVPAKKGGEAFQVYVFGGLYGDLPLQPNADAGRLVADTVCENHISFVLDVSQWIPSEQQRFVSAFIDRVFHRRKAAPAPMHLFVEECQEFAPQNPQGSEIDTLHVFQRLWKLGRNFGFGGSLISQRPQEINKKLLNMTGTMFCFQMTGPQERDAVRRWVVDAGAAADIPAILPRLERGHAYVERVEDNVSMEVAILPRVTADLSSTPKVGGIAAAKRELTPIDVERVSVALAATIEEQKQNDPKTLKASAKATADQLAKAQAALAAASLELTELRKRTAVKAPAIKDSDLKRIERIVARVDADRKELIGALAPLVVAISGLANATASSEPRRPLRPVSDDAPLHYERQMPMEPHGRLQHLASESAREAKTSTSDLPPGEVATLRAVVQFGQITREHLELETGYKRSSRKQYVSRLVTKGLVTSTKDHIIATDAGIAAVAALGPLTPLPVGDALYRWWLERLPAGERKALEIIHNDDTPGGIGVRQLEVAMKCKPSSRKQYVSRLARRGLVSASGGRVSASQYLFG